MSWVLSEEGARLALAFIASLYVVGLLIVNLDLGLHGIVTLQLARPEYIMAGFTWLLLTAIAALPWFALAELLPMAMAAYIRRAPSLSHTMFYIVGFSSPIVTYVGVHGIGLVALGVGVDQLTFGSLYAESFWALAAAVVAIALSVYPFGKFVLYRTGKPPFKGPDELTERMRLGIVRFAAVLAVPWLAAGIFAYTAVLYPYIPRVFGGGRKPVVLLVLKDATGGVELSRHGLPVSERDPKNSLAPVVLLLESNEAIIFRQPLGRESVPPGITAIKDWIAYASLPSIADGRRRVASRLSSARLTATLSACDAHERFGSPVVHVEAES